MRIGQVTYGHPTSPGFNKTVLMSCISPNLGNDCSLDKAINNGNGSQIRMKLDWCRTSVHPVITVIDTYATCHDIRFVSPFTVPAAHIADSHGVIEEDDSRENKWFINLRRGLIL